MTFTTKTPIATIQHDRKANIFTITCIFPEGTFDTIQFGQSRQVTPEQSALSAVIEKMSQDLGFDAQTMNKISQSMLKRMRRYEKYAVQKKQMHGDRLTIQIKLPPNYGIKIRSAADVRGDFKQIANTVIHRALSLPVTELPTAVDSATKPNSPSAGFRL